MERVWPRCGCGRAPRFFRYKPGQPVVADVTNTETICQSCAVVARLAGESFGDDSFDWEPIKYWKLYDDGQLISKDSRDEWEQRCGK